MSHVSLFMISLPQKPKIVKKEGNKAVFEIQGLYPGYGITLGNALRRVLLSSLGGAAITQIKIKDVPHEFSTLPGVYEDMILILLNLKKIRFKMFGDEPQMITLKASGEKEVKASDFKLPSQVEIVNKETPIATLTSKKAELEIEAQVERGIGYETIDQRKDEKKEIGVIALDSIFTPIEKVAFRVEDMRVGERTDFDKLVLEIWTDGTLEPEEAFYQAVDILEKHISLMSEEKETESKKKGTAKEKGGKAKPVRTAAHSVAGGAKKEPAVDNSKTKIEDLKISERSIKVLVENGIKTAAGLTKKTEGDVLALKGMGDAGLKEVKKALKKLELSLKE